jgi:hypothetical protein
LIRAFLPGPLHFAARHGRWCLVLGLLAGLALPGVALAMRPHLPALIALLLLLAALRIGPRTAMGSLDALGQTVRRVLLFQLAAPIAVLAILFPLGLATTSAGLVLVLMLAAPPVTGSPNLTILLGQDPAAAMRQLLVGTALLPLTVLPVLLLLPGLGDAADVIAGSLRLLAVIAASVGLAFALRLLVAQDLSESARAALDGASAIVLAVIVVGLMSAVAPALGAAPARLLAWLAFAMALNFGAQIAVNLALRGSATPQDRVAISVVAGNRNIALFLVSLPAATVEPLLLFIGCYQVPMYLTPILMRRVLR